MTKQICGIGFDPCLASQTLAGVSLYYVLIRVWKNIAVEGMIDDAMLRRRWLWLWRRRRRSERKMWRRRKKKKKEKTSLVGVT